MTCIGEIVGARRAWIIKWIGRILNQTGIQRIGRRADVAREREVVQRR